MSRQHRSSTSSMTSGIAGEVMMRPPADPNDQSAVPGPATTVASIVKRGSRIESTIDLSQTRPRAARPGKKPPPSNRSRAKWTTYNFSVHPGDLKPFFAHDIEMLLTLATDENNGARYTARDYLYEHNTPLPVYDEPEVVVLSDDEVEALAQKRRSLALTVERQKRRGDPPANTTTPRGGFYYRPSQVQAPAAIKMPVSDLDSPEAKQVAISTRRQRQSLADISIVNVQRPLATSSSAVFRGISLVQRVTMSRQRSQAGGLMHAHASSSSRLRSISAPPRPLDRAYASHATLPTTLSETESVGATSDASDLTSVLSDSHSTSSLRRSHDVRRASLLMSRTRRESALSISSRTTDQSQRLQQDSTDDDDDARQRQRRSRSGSAGQSQRRRQHRRQHAQRQRQRQQRQRRVSTAPAGSESAGMRERRRRRSRRRRGHSIGRRHRRSDGAERARSATITTANTATSSTAVAPRPRSSSRGEHSRGASSATTAKTACSKVDPFRQQIRDRFQDEVAVVYAELVRSQHARHPATVQAAKAQKERRRKKLQALAAAEEARAQERAASQEQVSRQSSGSSKKSDSSAKRARNLLGMFRKQGIDVSASEQGSGDAVGGMQASESKAKFRKFALSLRRRSSIASASQASVVLDSLHGAEEAADDSEDAVPAHAPTHRRRLSRGSAYVAGADAGTTEQQSESGPVGNEDSRSRGRRRSISLVRPRAVGGASAA